MNPELLGHHDFLVWLRGELAKRNKEQNGFFELDKERDKDKELMALALVSESYTIYPP